MNRTDILINNVGLVNNILKLFWIWRGRIPLFHKYAPASRPVEEKLTKTQKYNYYVKLGSYRRYKHLGRWVLNRRI